MLDTQLTLRDPIEAMNPGLLGVLKRLEGFRGSVYQDATGNPTIGYGHLIQPGQPAPTTVNPQQATQLLRRDATSAADLVRRAVTVPLSQGQFNALSSFAYNVGPTAFQQSALLRVLNSGHYGAVPAQLARWVHGNAHEIVPGLVARRRAEAALFQQTTK